MTDAESGNATGLDSLVPKLVALLVIGPPLYILSVGPTALLARWNSSLIPPLGTFFAPLIWLHENTPLAEPLKWYVIWWYELGG